MSNPPPNTAPPQSSVAPYILTGVCGYRRDCVFIRGAVRALDAERVPHGFIVRWLAGQWAHYTIDHGVTSHTVIDDGGWTVLSLCFDGKVHVASATGKALETIDDGPDGPNPRRWMYDIRACPSGVYAAGMGRRVYRRIAPGRWTRVDRDMRPKSDDEVDAGFRSIHGLPDGSLYAVGFEGEIWSFDSKRWMREDSPTNIRLDRVVCVSPDLTFICGGAGLLLRGTRGSWAVVEQQETTATLWGMEWFNDALYVADGKDLFRFSEDKFSKVEFRFDRPPSVTYLSARDRVLWAVGERDILQFDGSNWLRIDPPGSIA